jgi:dTDP-4-amino-4,6-dideoxygalactose transaminase
MPCQSDERLAIDGGTPTRRWGFHPWPVWSEEEEKQLLRVLRSAVWGIGSDVIAEFEQKFAALHQARFAVSVPNGTIALEIALRAAGISYGDEVICPPYTFIATASAVLNVGALPVFADIDPESYLIDPQRAAELIGPRTKAIIPVHIGGCPADLDGIKELARRHGLVVIEDCAQAHMAAWRGRRVGAIGDLGCFSFQSSKNITAGEGGAILTDDEKLADLAWSYHNVGRVRQGAWYQHEVLGVNARMTPWQAAVLLAQMGRAEEHLERREKNAALLSELLLQIPGIRPQKRDERVSHHAYHLFIFRYDKGAFGSRSRDEFLKALNAEGIPCSAGYVPLYRENAIVKATAALSRFTGQPARSPEEIAAQCPVTERVCREESCWLTQNILLGTEEDMADIARAIGKIQRAWG